jgi:hypothetical protein
VKYQPAPHRLTFTREEIAEALGIDLRDAVRIRILGFPQAHGMEVVLRRNFAKYQAKAEPM